MKILYISTIILLSIFSSFSKMNRFDKEKDAYFLENPFFRLPYMKIPVIKEGTLVANVYIQFDMKAFGKEAFYTAKILVPRIIDAVFRDLYGVLNRWFVESKLSSATLSNRVLQVANNVLGKNSVEMVYTKELFVSLV